MGCNEWLQSMTVGVRHCSGRVATNTAKTKVRRGVSDAGNMDARTHGGEGDV